MPYNKMSVKLQINVNAESHVKRRMRWKESATIMECAPKTLKSQTARIGGLVKFLTISMKIYCHQYQICSVTIYLSFHYQYQRILDKCECGKPCKVSRKEEALTRRKVRQFGEEPDEGVEGSTQWAERPWEKGVEFPRKLAR